MGKGMIAFCLVATGTMGGWLLASGLELAVHTTALREESPPCFEIGPPFHHRYRPNCVEMLMTPRGAVPFSVNEDGLRDLPRARILKVPRRVLVLGDSYVEGWWVDAGETIPSLLAAHFPGVYFVNGGLRSTGPLMQAGRLPKLLKEYKPERILWLVNDTDGADDRLTCALLKDPAAPADRQELGVEDFELDGFGARVAGWLGDSPLGRHFRQSEYSKRWSALESSERAKRCGVCRGVDEVARLARAAHTPLLATYLPGRPLKALYEGEASPRATLLDCLGKAGVATAPLDLSGVPPASLDSLFWDNDFHYTPEGNMRIGERLEPALNSWLGAAR